jgi:polyisoprenoid-binding protein YceI
MKKILLLTFPLFLFSFTENKSPWNFSLEYSQFEFIFTHLGISKIQVFFSDFEVDFHSEKEDFTDATFNFSLKTNSLNSLNAERDNDLKGYAGFECEKFSKIYFKSTGFRKLYGNTYKIFGNIEIMGIAKPMVLDAEFKGSLPADNNQKIIAFTISGIFKRSDFLLGKELEKYKFSDDVQLLSNLKFVLSK